MSSSPRDAIATLWSTIEEFADLPSTVALSKTCRALREEIVDADTRRIKAPHLVVGKRMPRHLLCALGTVHWPSLRHVDLSFTKVAETNDEGGEGDREMEACFSLFASQLAEAVNLERLRLDFSNILDGGPGVGDGEDWHTDADYNERYSPLFHLFGSNLAGCTKLHHLDILHDGIPHPSTGIPVDPIYDRFMMMTLLRALTPAIVQQRGVLRRLRFNSMHGSWADVLPFFETWGPFHDAATAFFASILSCNGLHDLEINVPRCRRLGWALVNAAGQVQTKSVSLRRLWICVHGPSDAATPGLGYQWCPLQRNDYGLSKDELVARSGMLLNHFSDCSELEELNLGLTMTIWVAHFDVISSMLRRQSELSSLALSFGYCRDSNGVALRLIRECAIAEGQRKISNLRVELLSGVSGKRLCRFLADTGNNFCVDYRKDGKWISATEKDIPRNQKVDISRLLMDREGENCIKIYM